MLAFSVIDQGPGIPKEWQHKVFDKFVHLETPTKGVSASSGLGLHFCQQAVRAQGGRIHLQHRNGRGTTITFTLPSVTLKARPVSET